MLNQLQRIEPDTFMATTSYAMGDKVLSDLIFQDCTVYYRSLCGLIIVLSQLQRIEPDTFMATMSYATADCTITTDLHVA